MVCCAFSTHGIKIRLCQLWHYWLKDRTDGRSFLLLLQFYVHVNFHGRDYGIVLCIITTIKWVHWGLLYINKWWIMVVMYDKRTTFPWKWNLSLFPDIAGNPGHCEIYSVDKLWDCAIVPSGHVLWSPSFTWWPIKYIPWKCWRWSFGSAFTTVSLDKSQNGGPFPSHKILVDVLFPLCFKEDVGLSLTRQRK